MNQTGTAARYTNPDLPIHERVDDLVSRMTLKEKISQMVHTAPAIPRLGVPEYNWWNECLHGVARAGTATVFPQAIGMAASFDTGLMHDVAAAISDEARAKHHQAIRQGNLGQYFGLTFWSPNINLFRDPRWGRGHETYGEDPFLTGRMGVAFVRGLQGDDPRYLKVVATAKHYAVHSGPEADRHHFDAVVTPRDLRETYLPAFKACVVEGKAESIMGAYNRTNGEACCASRTLLGEILRKEWGFQGYVVSDCNAIRDIHEHHRVTRTPAESAALAVRNGCELNCGEVYWSLSEAVQSGLIDEGTIDEALRRLFTARFRLGMFDPPERVPYAQIPPEVVGCQRHRDLALRMARESLVLLKNDGGLLPLRKDMRQVLVVGPNANSIDVLLGNYNGFPASASTALEGIVGKVSAGTNVLFCPGCDLFHDSTAGFGAAVGAARQSDVIIAVMGLAPSLEGEEGDAAFADASGDRVKIGLPRVQEELLKQLATTGKPIVLVLNGGSAIAMPWAAENMPAILCAWYPGQEGGRALGDVLFGDYSPAGRLPVTFVKDVAQLPDFEVYDMEGRTYRFMKEPPLFHFGHGLSYTSFRYDRLRLSPGRIRAGEPVGVTVDVTNVGHRPGEEVVQLYAQDVDASVPVPRIHLEGFTRVYLAPGERRNISFRLNPDQMVAYTDDGRAFVEPGEYRISVGGGQPDDPASGAVSASLLVMP